MPKGHQRRRLVILVVTGEVQSHSVAGFESPRVGNQRDAVMGGFSNGHCFECTAWENWRTGPAGFVEFTEPGPQIAPCHVRNRTGSINVLKDYDPSLCPARC